MVLRTSRVIRRLQRRGCAGLLVLLFTVPSEAAVRHVVLLQSFDRGTLVLDRFTADFRVRLDERLGEPVTFIQFVVSPAGFDETPQQAFIEFLRAAFDSRPMPDLVVTVGGPAAAFARDYRARLFPGAPLLFTAVDHRFLRDASLAANETAAAVANEPTRVVDDILHLFPDTANVFVVNGSGELGRFWRQEFERDTVGFRNRVRFVWSDGLSYAEVLKRVATLPPRSAIFFQSFDVDADGAAYSTERALSDIRAHAHAPLFGAQGAELGYGIVGGHLVSTDAIARTSADAAFQILQGISPARIRIPVQQPGPAIFDWRELQRWGVDEDRLPAGSVVRFRELNVWERYRWGIIAGASALLAQTLLISALLLNRVKRRRAEQSLRESEGRFRVLANSAPVMIRMSAADALAMDFNIPWLEFTRRSLDEELGNGWLAGIHPEDVAASVQTYRRAFDQRLPYRMEYRLRRFDGEYRWVLDSGEPRFTPDGSFAGYIGSAVDVTDLKTARATLSNLNGRLIQAQEQERSRLARELHDDVCQRMTVLALDLRRLGESIPERDGGVRGQLLGLYDDVTSLGRDVNGISHRLHSSKLELLGLAAAAGAFCKEIATHHDVNVTFVHEDVPAQLGESVAINMFRVLQEALSNAVKHSGASGCRVSLRRIGYELQLEVEDHGRGFEVAATVAASGLGLVTMQERLRLVNGELVIASKPGTGTTVLASVPLRQHVAADIATTVDAGTAT